jgi:TrmH family RNA methyltransferase
MGSIARVTISYLNLDIFLSEVSVPVYGSFMKGNSVYSEELPKTGVLIMGNEGKGISDTVKNTCDYRVTIPRYGKSKTESLNVATATAILMNELRRE